MQYDSRDHHRLTHSTTDPTLSQFMAYDKVSGLPAPDSEAIPGTHLDV